MNLNPSGSWEQQRVAELRARSVPWNHVSAQLGKPEITLRQIYEPLLPPVQSRPDPSVALRGPEPPEPDEPTEPAPATPRRPKVRAPRPYQVRGGKPDSLPNRVLSLLLTLECGMVEVADAMGVTPRAADSAISLLRRCGLIEATSHKRPKTWRVTKRGREKLALARAESTDAGRAKAEGSV